jgi:large subunit ribosomal protein L23
MGILHETLAQVANTPQHQKAPGFGRFVGRRRSWKKAFVSLKPGQEINLAAGETK